MSSSLHILCVSNGGIKVRTVAGLNHSVESSCIAKEVLLSGGGGETEERFLCEYVLGLGCG